MSEANVAKDNFYIVTYEKNSWATPSSQDLMHSRRQYNTTARNKDSVIFEILYNSTPQFSGNPISGGSLSEMFGHIPWSVDIPRHPPQKKRAVSTTTSCLHV